MTSPISPPEAQAQNQELALHIEEALAELTELQRKTLELRWTGLSSKEVATQLGCSPQAAKRRYQSAIERLRRRFGG